MLNEFRKRTYAFRAGDTGWVKIGRSCDPIVRLTDLRNGCPFGLSIDWVLWGDYEKELHLKFKDRRGLGEWFWLTLEESHDAVCGKYRHEPGYSWSWYQPQSLVFPPEAVE